VSPFTLKGMRAEPGELPNVTELHPSADGTGLEISGYFSTWDADSENEAFHPQAFTSAIPRFLANNPVVVWAHSRREPPLGYVKSLEVKPRGLYGTMVLPKPTADTKAYEVYCSIADGRWKPAFSVGGVWERFNVGGKVKLLCKRLLEISLAANPVNELAVSTGVATCSVKAIDMGQESPPVGDQIQRRVLEHELDKLDVQIALAAVILQ